MKKQQGGIAPTLENTDKNLQACPQHVPTTDKHYIIQSRFKPAVLFKLDYKLIVIIPSKIL